MQIIQFTNYKERIMKIRIQLNDIYAKALLSDRTFKNNFDFVVNDQ